MTLTQDILAHALALGFDIAGVMPMSASRHGAAFIDWLATGYHGELSYLAARAAERMDPVRFAPGAHSMIMVAANYNPGISSAGDVPGQGRIARYAWGPDYHDVIKPRLYAIDTFIRARTGREALGRVFVDTAPVLERDFAEQAGLGFIGRNCCLITPGLGSWTFLAGLLVPEKLTTDVGRWMIVQSRMVHRPSHREASRSSIVYSCGRCTRCLDACPTQAFVAPHVLDARRCISYLTIELRGPIPHSLRPLMGNWVFGCDICQEVCPYNRVVPPAQQACEAGRGIALIDMLALDEPGFRARFRGTSVLRTRRRGLVRNACVAAGNAGDPALVPILVSLMNDAEPLIRGHAAWALRRIDNVEANIVLAQALAVETDPWVRSEILPRP